MKPASVTGVPLMLGSSTVSARASVRFSAPVATKSVASRIGRAIQSPLPSSRKKLRETSKSTSSTFWSPSIVMRSPGSFTLKPDASQLGVFSCAVAVTPAGSAS